MKKLTINKRYMSDDFRFKVMKMKITSEEQIFEILANQDKYSKLILLAVCQ